MWLKPKICRKSLFHTNEVAGYNKSVEGSILFIENIEKINSRVLLIINIVILLNSSSSIEGSP
ncbi:hypothetical protein SFRURICE_009957 [Spodoptera frugiperda]|nr:hypothetical protein SFRURICE_009957 [Spodoptera frugiperda]